MTASPRHPAVAAPMPEPLPIALVVWIVITLGILLRGVLHLRISGVIIAIIVGWGVLTVWIAVAAFTRHRR